MTEHPITGFRVGIPSAVPGNYGDTWCMTLGDDGVLYTPSDDTFGFEVPDFFTPDAADRWQNDGERFVAELTTEQKDAFGYRPISFERLVGDNPLKLKGTTVNRMPEYAAQDRYREALDGDGNGGTWTTTWKSSGCTLIDGTIYWVIYRQRFNPETQHFRRTDASIIASDDLGKTWRRSASENLDRPMFPGFSFASPYFIDYGPSGADVDGSTRWVYAVSNDAFWDNGNQLILGRVSRDRIGALDPKDWQYYTGDDGISDDAWSSNAEAASPIVSDPGRVGMSSVAYLPDRNRYMAITWHYTHPYREGLPALQNFEQSTNEAMWDLWESPKPWGPWRRVASHTWAPEGFYTPTVIPKFQSVNRVYVATAGDWSRWKDGFYSLHIVPIDLE